MPRNAPAAHEWAKAVADLNVDLQRIRNWCFENRLLLNPDKSKLIVYGSRQRLQSLQDVHLSLLGVTFGSSLTFQEHIVKTVSSCFSSLPQIDCVKHVFDRSTSTTIIGHFWVPSGLCFKTRVSGWPLIWKSFFILMQIKLIFTRKVLHLASFWKWRFLERGSGLLTL